MKRFLKRLLLFLLLVLVINSVLNTLFFSLSDQRYTYRYNYLIKHPDYNTVFWGTSRTLRHVVPSYFDSVNNKKGISTHTFNLGTPANKSGETYFQYEQFLTQYALSAQKNVKYAFVEVNSLTYIANRNISSAKSYYWLTPQNLLFAYQYFKDDKQGGLLKKVQKYVSYSAAFLVRQFGFNYLSIKKEDTSTFLGSHHDGYNSLEDEANGGNEEYKLLHIKFVKKTELLAKRAAKVAPDFDPQKYRPYLNKAHIEKLNSLMSESKKLGIKLIFVIQPRVDTYLEVMNVADNFKGDVIELANPAVYKDFWEVNNAYDIGHMNKGGAQDFTEHLSEKFTHLLHPDTVVSK